MTLFILDCVLRLKLDWMSTNISLDALILVKRVQASVCGLLQIDLVKKVFPVWLIRQENKSTQETCYH